MFGVMPLTIEQATNFISEINEVVQALENTSILASEKMNSAMDLKNRVETWLQKNQNDQVSTIQRRILTNRLATLAKILPTHACKKP